MTESPRYLVRFLALQAVVVLSTGLANAIVAASPHWETPSAGSYLLMLFLGLPAVLVFAEAARTRAQVVAVAAFIAFLLAWCGFSMASTDASTAGLAFLGYPFFATIAAVLTGVARWLHDRRVRQRRIHQK